MSEIRDRVYDKICEICLEETCMPDCPLLEGECKWRKKLFAIPELAIVDRDAKLPKCPLLPPEGAPDVKGYRLAERLMLKAGWVKEVKDG